MKQVIEAQPEDSSLDEILREVAMDRMIKLDLADSRNERIISNEDMKHRILQWQK